ncbi:MAG: PAS domain-containing sensor histidine kinase, partial [Candidatus Nucleicultricaceae bacterium]
SIRWFSEQGHVVSHKNSQKFVAAIIFDVTELKEKNKRMQTLYSALHNAVEGISILTNDLCLIEVNQAFSNLFSLNENQIIGNALCEFLHPDDQEPLQRECKQHKNERFSFMARVKMDTNHFLYAQLLFVPIFGTDGHKTGYYCFAKDLTPLLERERALSEALAKTKSAYQAKSEFLANVSHELRTPLNAIIGYSELILEEEDLTTKVVLQDVEKIKHAGTHLLKLINDILDASKLEAGKIELHYETFDIFDFANTLVSLLIPSAQKLENRVILNCNHDIGLMTSDYTRLRQCLLNLMSNACKFTQKGIITLTITHTVINTISYIQFKVSDTGCGIGPKALKKLFQPFTQGDSSTTRRYGGTGLGLSITKQFTELLGGCIDVQSEYGRGSTFTILIPQQQPTLMADSSEQNHSIPSSLKNVV